MIVPPEACRFIPVFLQQALGCTTATANQDEGKIMDCNAAVSSHYIEF